MLYRQLADPTSPPRPGGRRGVAALVSAVMVVAGTLTAVGVVVAPPASAALDTTLYAVASDTIYTLNETTGATTSQPTTLPFNTAALARQPGSNLLYYYEQLSPYRVGTYDVVTHTTDVLSGNGPASLVRLAFRADGALYGMSGSNDLYQLNTTTGAALGVPEVVAGPSLSGGGDIAFQPDNHAYVIVGDQLFSLPVPYSTATLVGATAGDVNAHPNLAFGSGGLLWTASSVGGNSNVGYLALDTGTQTTMTTTSGYTFSDMASVPDRAPTTGNTSTSTTYHTPVTTDVSSLLSDPDGDPVAVTAVSVTGGITVGTASIDGSGRPVFTPAVGYSGTASVIYTASDGVGGSTDGTITVTVTPAATNDSVAAAAHTLLTISILANDHGTLDPTTVRVITAPTHGTVSVLVTGELSYTPDFGFSGPDSLDYDVADAVGNRASATVQISTQPPPPPVAAALTSTGRGTTPQTAAAISLPPGVTVTLLTPAGSSTSRVELPGEGIYVLDRPSGVITFTPELGFTGTATPVTYRLTDGYGSTAAATYTPTVAPPVPPTAPEAITHGPAGATQSAVVTIPPGGAITLIAPGGTTTNSVTTMSGTYILDPATGVITFTPVHGFIGTALPVLFRLTDAYGQSVESHYTAIVSKVPLPPTANVAIDNLTSAGAGSLVRARCSVSSGRVAYCKIILTARVGGRTALIGHGTVVIRGAGSAGPVTVRIQLTSIGRKLSRRPGGVNVTATASTRAIGSKTVVKVAKAASVVQPQVLVLHPVYFDTAKSIVHRADRTYLAKLRTKLDGVRTVRCVGYTDNRDKTKYNYELGLARARAVCSLLVSGRSFKTVTISQGEARPDASNDTKAGRARNRRTEIVLVY